MAKLNQKQKRFVVEYLIDLNATQSAIRAGYAEKTAYSQGQRLLKHVEIQAAIQKAQANREKRTELNADWVLTKLKEVAERCMQGEPVMVREGDKVVESGEWKFDSSGANKSLELIGRHLGMFTDNVKLSGQVGVKIVDDIK